jgi:endonuclease YncB( thermonuclease family)
VKHLAAILSAVLYSSPILAFADFSGPVVSVLDGDTIEVLHNRHPDRIRLSGIDCPEKYNHSQSVTLAPSFYPSYNTPPYEAPMRMSVQT